MRSSTMWKFTLGFYASLAILDLLVSCILKDFFFSSNGKHKLEVYKLILEGPCWTFFSKLQKFKFFLFGCPTPIRFPGLCSHGWGNWRQGGLQQSIPRAPPTPSWGCQAPGSVPGNAAFAAMEHFHEPPELCLCAVTGEWGFLPSGVPGW